jgi:type I restriction enzyme S subunit
VGKFFVERTEKVDDVNYPPLSVTMSGVVDQLSDVAKSDDSGNRKLVRRNDFVINSRSDRKGSSGIAPRDGSVSLINIVLEPRDVDPQYIQYLLKSYFFKEEFFRNGKGIHWDLWTTRWEQLKNINIPVPPYEDQGLISQYLDKKTGQIDRLVEKIQKKIDLLKEQRTSLINHYVTKGLDPNVEMKDSGVEWIGEIPSNWVLSKLKYLGVFVSGYSFDSNVFQEEGTVRVVKISNIQSDGISWDDLSFVPDDYWETYSQFQIRYGDLLFVLTRPIISTGIKVFFYDQPYNSLLNQRNSIYRVTNNLLSKDFLFFLVRTQFFLTEFKSQLKETGQPNISTEQISNIVIPVPPVEEQESISENLRDTTSWFDRVIHKELHRIRLLTEYRQSLISSAVTGKIRITEDMI